MIAQMYSLAELHAPKRRGRKAAQKKVTRTEALVSWIDAVIYWIQDLTAIRTARKRFEEIDGEPVAKEELAADFVRSVPDGDEFLSPLLMDAVPEPEAVRADVKPKAPRPRGARVLCTKYDAEAVGKRLRAARIQAGFNRQRVLATLADVSEGQVSLMENGSRRATDGTLHKLAVALGVTLEWLKTGRREALPGGAR